MRKILIVSILLGLYSISFAGFGGDSLGSHKATKSLNMTGHDIQNVDDVECNSFSGSPDGSNIVNLATACAGGTIYKDVPFFAPGDAYVTNGIDYRAPLGYDMSITTVVVSVSNDGTMPSGSDLNFDIKISTGGSEQNTFYTIFNTTYSLRITSGSCWGQATTSDLAVTELKQNYIIRLDITQIGSTNPGGDPILGSIWGTQD